MKRFRFPRVVPAGTLLVLAAAAAQSSQGPSVERFSWSDPPPLATPFPAPSPELAPLPAPSIAEPFAIGEALYDPGRVPEGVMSLLARMRIGVASASGPAPTGGLTLDESEVRTLIALAEDDLASAEDIENLPFGFEDLHRAVSGLLPQLTIDQLAETYTRVYEAQPDALVAKVMMGQPLEPETRLTRAQIWLLLMDGFAGPGGADASYGTADRELPDLPSPNPAWSAAEWREALARLPLVAASRVLTVENAVTGTTVRLATPLPPLLSRRSGKPLVAPRTGSLAGQEVTWALDGESGLQGLATPGTPTGQPTRVGANGLARFSFAPNPTSGGPGEVVQEWASVSAALPACPLVSSAYVIPQAMCDFVLGPRRVKVDIPFSWRTTDKMRVQIHYKYALQLQAPIGAVRREGWDVADGWIVRRPNGTYTGTMLGQISADQTVRGSQYCGRTIRHARQQLHVEGRMLPAGAVPGTGARMGGNARTRDLGSYRWATPGSQPLEFVLGASWAQQPPGEGYLVLEFFPKSVPVDLAGRPIPIGPNNPTSCLPMLKATQEQIRKGGNMYFIPFNDAQWTTPDAGYAIGLRKARDYYFVDDNNSTSVLGDFAVTDAAGGSGRPRWSVHVQRTSLAP
jgi:hypothetical protein